MLHKDIIIINACQYSTECIRLCIDSLLETIQDELVKVTIFLDEDSRLNDCFASPPNYHKEIECVKTTYKDIADAFKKY